MAQTTQAQQSSTLPIHQATPTANANKPQPGNSDQTGSRSSVKIPDGRKNSIGEAVSSPTETWRPNFARSQSWNHEDLRREHTMTEIQKGRGTLGGGFTETVAGGDGKA